MNDRPLELNAMEYQALAGEAVMNGYVNMNNLTNKFELTDKGRKFLFLLSMLKSESDNNSGIIIPY